MSVSGGGGSWFSEDDIDSIDNDNDGAAFRRDSADRHVGGTFVRRKTDRGGLRRNNDRSAGSGASGRGGGGGARGGGRGNNRDFRGRSERERGDDYRSRSYDSTSGRRGRDQSFRWDARRATYASNGGRSGGRGGDISARLATSANVGAIDVGKINLRSIEAAGYEHLYGIAPVLNALKANVRNFGDANNDNDMNQNNRSQFDDINDEGLFGSKTIKPEARLSPHLFVQESTASLSNKIVNSVSSRRSSSLYSTRSDAKKEATAEIFFLATKVQLPIIHVDKGVLNAMCGSRPHQGYVLRCGKLDYVPTKKLPKTPSNLLASVSNGPSLWLALDEVVDPQNLGALLRSAFFLGGGAGRIDFDNDDDFFNNDDTTTTAVGRKQWGKVGILVCSKNSSPLSPTVSAASAGALEFMTIYSTSNLPKLLMGARDDGWRVLGAAVDGPDSTNVRDDDDDDDENDYNEWVMDKGVEEEEDSNDDAGSVISTKLQPRCFNLDEIETGCPTIIVLGSEGRGLRTLVARACTGFVRIPGGGEREMLEDYTGNDEGKTRSGVDSLNVSVTGGILLWHFLSRQ